MFLTQYSIFYLALCAPHSPLTLLSSCKIVSIFSKVEWLYRMANLWGNVGHFERISKKPRKVHDYRFILFATFLETQFLLSLLSYSNVLEVVCALVEWGGGGGWTSMEFDQLSTLWFFKPLFCRVSNSVGKKQLNAMQM